MIELPSESRMIVIRHTGDSIPFVFTWTPSASSRATSLLDAGRLGHARHRHRVAVAARALVVRLTGRAVSLARDAHRAVAVARSSALVRARIAEERTYLAVHRRVAVVERRAITRRRARITVESDRDASHGGGAADITDVATR